MRKAWMVVGGCALVMLSGCSSINPFSSKPDPKNAPAALVEVQQKLAVKKIWSTSVGKSGDYVFTPVYARDSIFTAAADGSVTRMSATTGAVQWRVSAGIALIGGVGSDGNTVAVGGEKGMLIAFDGDGKLRWKVQASSEILSAPIVGEGLVVVRSLDNRIAAYEIESGKRKWVLERPLPPLTMRASPGMAIVGPTLVVAQPGGKLLSLMLSNGGARWEVSVGDPRGTTELERIADIAGYPAVFGRDVCAAAYQSRIACVDAVSGATRWSKKFSGGAGVGVDNLYVYGVDDRGAVYAFSRDGGQSVWRNDKLTNRGLSAPIPLGRVVAVADSQGYVHFMARDDGSFVNRLPTDGSAITATPLLAGSSLIVQTRNGTLSAFAAE